MALMTKKNKDYGYGQVEPNHLSAQRTGQIYAQLPCASAITTLQNGQFIKYAYGDGECNFSGDGEWMLVFNEVKLYGDRQSYRDFVYATKDFTDGKMYPRVFKTNVGDIMTTNMVELGDKDTAGLALKDKLTIDAATGTLKYAATPTAGEMVWQVAKIYTLADGAPAVKIQRIA